MKKARTSNTQTRERLVETADRLFYREGFRAVGIDRIIAEAGVAKMTLYTHFRSKDDLILAVLQHRDGCVLDGFQQAIARHRATGKDGFKAFFAALKEWFASPGFRGCAFINATVELADATHAGVEYVRGQKRRFRGMLEQLIVESYGPAAANKTDAIALLVEGAIVTAQRERDPAPADTALEAATRLLDYAIR